MVAVGIPVTRYPPRRSQRALLTHWAPPSSTNVKAVTLLDAHQPTQSTRLPGAVSGPRLSDRCSSWAKSFPPHPPPRAGSHCSVASSVIRLCPTSHLRSYLLLSLYFNKSTRCAHRVQMRPPRFRTKDFSTCMGSTTAQGSMSCLPNRITRCCLLLNGTGSAPRS